MNRPLLSSEFMQYLASTAGTHSDSGRLPSLTDLAQELGISVASLREQVEVAKALGLLEARPRLGMRRLPYSFLPAIRESLAYAMRINSNYFMLYSDLRNHLEAAYWEEAVRELTPDDITDLQRLIEQAWDKLSGPQIQIPHEEHRQLHLLIFSRLNNPFVLGILEAYWEAYEAVGLGMFTDYDYLQQVWTYHERMVDAVSRGDLAAGYQALVEHKDLLHHRPSSNGTERLASKRD